jgi:dolichol-phosphate mannosyltransferase
MLSIIIPARNESDNLQDILNHFEENLLEVDFEVLLINDFSDDETLSKAKKIFDSKTKFKVFDNKKKGLGGAINLGIQNASGDKVVIMMADMSDHIDDLKKYNDLIDKENLDAVLGSRFIKGSEVISYPFQKLILNRAFNLFVSLIFWNKYNDYTNAFKIYKKKMLKDLMPLVSESFNIFLEIPLKVISRNYTYKIIPIKWMGRKKGKAKFKIKELRSKYLFTLIYCFIEKNLLNIKK